MSDEEPPEYSLAAAIVCGAIELAFYFTAVGFAFAADWKMGISILCLSIFFLIQD